MLFRSYAAVTFQNAKDVLLMGWGMNWQYAAQTPTEGYCGQATLARKLSLTEVDGALTLAAAPAGLEKFRHSSYPIENHTTIRTETFGLKVSGKGDAKICLKNSVGQKLKIYVTDTKITVDRTMAGYKEFSEHFMTEKYSISTAAKMCIRDSQRSGKIRREIRKNFRSDRKLCRQNCRSRRPGYVPEMVRGHRSRV